MFFFTKSIPIYYIDYIMYSEHYAQCTKYPQKCHHRDRIVSSVQKTHLFSLF